MHHARPQPINAIRSSSGPTRSQPAAAAASRRRPTRRRHLLRALSWASRSLMLARQVQDSRCASVLLHGRRPSIGICLLPARPPPAHTSSRNHARQCPAAAPHLKAPPFLLDSGGGRKLCGRPALLLWRRRDQGGASGAGRRAAPPAHARRQRHLALVALLRAQALPGWGLAVGELLQPGARSEHIRTPCRTMPLPLPTSPRVLLCNARRAATGAA